MKTSFNLPCLMRLAGAVALLLGGGSQAYAHSYYNLTGAGSLASGDAAIGFGIANSINGTDGVSAGSNPPGYRVSNGTNTLYDPVTNNMIPGTGTMAGTATEVPGNLPYMWYSGMHTKATGVTKRELFTGSSVGDNTGNLINIVGTGNGNTLILPNGQPITAPATGSWGTNTVNSLWRAYDLRYNSTPPTGWTGPWWNSIMQPLPSNGDHPYLAVEVNSTSTGRGMDYGLIHISCGANTAVDNCVTTAGNPSGNLLVTISVKNDADYSQYQGLLDVALYRGVDTTTGPSGSSRFSPYTFGGSNPQGSNLGAPIWTASMNSVSDLLFYSFVFDQNEWNLTGQPGYSTNGFYTLIVSAHGGSSTDGVAYDVLVTTSPVPVPAAMWLLGSSLLAWLGLGKARGLKLAEPRVTLSTKRR